MASVIIGATSMEHLKTSIGAADVTLPPAVIKRIAGLHKQYPAPI